MKSVKRKADIPLLANTDGIEIIGRSKRNISSNESKSKITLSKRRDVRDSIISASFRYCCNQFKKLLIVNLFFRQVLARRLLIFIIYVKL